MILVIDACTISNLLHTVQDDSLIRYLNRTFNQVFLTKEVIKEIEENKYNYLSYYDNSRVAINQLIFDLKLSSFLSPFDKDKHECTTFVRNFSVLKNMPLKESAGEFHCALLSLYISRLGEINFMENNNKVLFATDDGKAQQLYSELFSTNQIGAIIDSTDLLSIFYLKGMITKSALLKHFESLIKLYSYPVMKLKQLIVNIKKEKIHSSFQLSLTKLMELIEEFDLQNLTDTLSANPYKNLYRNYPKLKEAAKELSETRISKTITYLLERKWFVTNNLLWDVHLS